MKICFFNRSYWPDQAATGQLLTELAEDLVARHGCEVSVVAGRALHGRESRTRSLGPISPVTTRRAAGRADSARERHALPLDRFAGRASNYVTYFASADAASWRLGGRTSWSR